MYWGFKYLEQTGDEPQNSAQALIQLRKGEVRGIYTS